MKSTEIKNNIAKTEQRLAEIRAMVTTSRSELKSLQTGFINGKTEVDAVQFEQGRLDTLQSSIGSLETRLAELKSDLTAAERDETIQAGIQRLKDIATHAAGAYADFDQERVKLGDSLTDIFDKLFAQVVAFTEEQKEFRAQYNKTETLIDRQQIVAQLEQAGVSQAVIKLMEAESLTTMPAGKYEGAVVAGLSIAGLEKYQKERAAAERASWESRQAAAAGLR